MILLYYVTNSINAYIKRYGLEKKVVLPSQTSIVYTVCVSADYKCVQVNDRRQ